jgi:hypothetical protein
VREKLVLKNGGLMMQLAHEEARLYAAGDVKGAALIAELVAIKVAAGALVDLIEASVRDSDDDVTATIDTTKEAYQELLAALDLVL